MEALNDSLRNNVSGGGSAGLAHTALPLNVTPYTYALPITDVIGIVLNVFLAANLRMPCSRYEITAIYLKAITVSDLGFLVFALFPWLHTIFQINVYHRVGFCQLANFAMTAFPSLSLFFTLSFAINGVIWKSRPWIRQELPAAFGTKAILVGIAFFTVYLHAYPVWFWESSTDTLNQCTVHYKNVRYFKAFLQFDLFKDILIQVTLVAVAVGYEVWGGQLDKNPVPTASTTSFSAELGNNYTDIYGLDFHRFLVTFTVSVVFFNLPNSAVVLASLYSPVPDSQIWPHLIAFLFHIPFALKPLGYIIVSSEFRDLIKASRQNCVETISNDINEESERLHTNL